MLCAVHCQLNKAIFIVEPRTRRYFFFIFIIIIIFLLFFVFVVCAHFFRHCLWWKYQRAHREDGREVRAWEQNKQIKHQTLALRGMYGEILLFEEYVQFTEMGGSNTEAAAQSLNVAIRVRTTIWNYRATEATMSHTTEH